MNSQRRGTTLSVHIRLALLSLGLDPQSTQYEGINLKRATIATLENVLLKLRAEQRARGLLKAGY